ncbi:MAG: hypothetical protein IJ489_11185 [Clostridia bacterium]|nr:hypothetical protein [Clostridia bacterium]
MSRLKNTVVSILLLSIFLLSVSSCRKTSSEEIPKRENTISYYDGGTLENTSTRILYHLDDQLCYYNKITGETAVFCFDPMCRHGDWRTCISLRFELNGLISLYKIKYNEYDNRFYSIRGDKLCSFSFDGSDLKIVYSFGEKGALDEHSAGGSVYNLRIAKNRLYVNIVNAEKGGREIVYYDIDTGKLHNLTENLEGQFYDFWIFEGSLYFEMLHDEEIALYRSDLDMKNICKTEIEGVFGDSLFHQDQSYYVSYREENKQTFADAIMCYDLESGEINKVCSLENEGESNLQPCILAVSDTYVYFIKREPIHIGYEVIRGTIEQHMYNDFSKIYRADLQSGEVTVIFDDPSCEVTEIYFLQNKKVLIKGWFCKYGEGDAEKTDAIFIAEVDENGNFVNMEKLEDPR